MLYPAELRGHVGHSLAQLRRARHALRVLAVAACAWLAGPGAAAAGAPEGCAVPAGETVSVASVGDDGALELRDGRRVLLSGIVLPDGAWRARSVALLRELAAGREGRLARLAPADRHGRLAGRFVAEGGEAAARLVAAGLAYAFADGDAACAAALDGLEASARRAGLGLWSDPGLLPLPAGLPARIIEKRGQFVLVEGTVLSLGERPRRTYLNFGTFWNEDFTAYMDTDVAARIAPAGLAPGDLKGRRVRIRGYVLEERGPAIAVTRPGQLELVEER